MERGFRREAALKAIEQTDHERSSFAKFAFAVDWENPELYDVILNMDKLSVQLAVNTVIQMARSEDIKACSIDAMKSIEMMGLTHRAEAALIEAGLTYGPTTYISISVSDPGKIRLSGMVESQAGKKRAEEVLKNVKGVELIDNQIRVAPADRHV
jgi:hypothetical protein